MSFFDFLEWASSRKDRGSNKVGEWSFVQLRFCEQFFGELLLLEFAAQVSLIFGMGFLQTVARMGLKLGGWVELGLT